MKTFVFVIAAITILLFAYAATALTLGFSISDAWKTHKLLPLGSKGVFLGYLIFFFALAYAASRKIFSK
jgi:L-asparagine transporter-like permease